jgi:hypothetical protein
MGIAQEPYYICDICGRKKPVSQMAGKCSVCGQYICSMCAKMVGEKIYCERHVPAPPPQPKTGCFIATAAYGSPLALELDVLRAFRDRKMLRSKAGKIMVLTYYRVSPPIASLVARKEILKRIVRNCIDPIVGLLKGRGF